jgi:hypothetical protein
VHLTTIRSRVEASGSSDVRGPLIDLEVEAPVNLEDQDAAAREIPFAVGPATPAGAVGPRPLAVGECQPMPPAHASHRQLGRRVGTGIDVSQAPPEGATAAQGTKQVDPLLKLRRGGEPLLNRGGQHAVRGTGLGLVGGEQ